MAKVVLILCDALRDDLARERMGFLQHLVESRRATRYTVLAELPTLSRPCYEAIHTGTPAVQHEIWHNRVVRPSKMPNLFALAWASGMVTAAAAYSWISELYNGVPFDPVEDREVDDPGRPIQHGRFYSQDDFPDAELIGCAAMLFRRFRPDYLLVHPMGLDFLGERHGAESAEYRNWIARQDALLASVIPEWLGAGCTVFVTGDHGMNADGSHGGASADVRNVPLYVMQPESAGRGDTGRMVSQLQIAPTICANLGIPRPATMGLPAIEEVEPGSQEPA